jgi:hypothetical protein
MTIIRLTSELDKIEVELSKLEGIPLDGFQRERLTNLYLTGNLSKGPLSSKWVSLMVDLYEGQRSTTFEASLASYLGLGGVG